MEFTLTDKPWGKSHCVFNNGLFESHVIYVSKGGFCSQHYHEHKYNRFYVISGMLNVIEYLNKDDTTKVLENTITLEAMDFYDIKPGVLHKFHAITDVVACEIYWPFHSNEDIIRKTTGGITS